RQLDAQGKGATQRNISQTILKSWPIPLPTLAEQRRIVEILEDLLSRLDTAEASLQLGAKRLPAVWASGIANLILPGAAKSVLAGEPARLGDIDPPDVPLPDGWRWSRWSEVGTCQNGKAFPSRDYQDSGV